MKIAFIVNHFPALSETFILNQITGLIDRGHEVDIFADCPGDVKKMHPDVEKYRLLDRTSYIGVSGNRLIKLLKVLQSSPRNLFKHPLVLLKSLNFRQYGHSATSLNLLYAAVRLLERQTVYDIIHGHFGPNGLNGVFFRDLGLLQGKLVTTFYGYDISEFVRTYGEQIYNPLFEHGEMICLLSNHMKLQLIKLGCNEGKLKIHPLGVNPDKFLFIPRQRPSDGIFKVVTTARLVEKKGIEYSIKAVANLVKTGMRIEYIVVGDGSLRENLQQLVQQLDVQDNIHLLGWKQQMEVIEILKTAHIFVLHSVTSQKGDQEGTPTVLMEAMAMGLPVVSTYHSGIPEVVEDGISGFLVPERDVEALTEKLGDLIEHPERWADMGRAGRSFIEEHYHIDKLNDRLVELYQSLIQQ